MSVSIRCRGKRADSPKHLIVFSGALALYVCKMRLGAIYEYLAMTPATVSSMGALPWRARLAHPAHYCDIYKNWY